MFKIIFLALAGVDGAQDHNFNILPESFKTREEARDFVIGTVIPEDKGNFLEGFDDDEIEEMSVQFDVQQDISDDDYEIDYEVYTYGDLVYRNEYKIVEIN